MGTAANPQIDFLKTINAKYKPQKNSFEAKEWLGPIVYSPFHIDCMRYCDRRKGFSCLDNNYYE